MITIAQLLTDAGITYDKFSENKSPEVYRTMGNQLIETYENLKRFRSKNPNYHGWHRHHVVEKQHLESLHVTHLWPPENDQLCVPLPERAHIGRINSIIRTHAPIGAVMSPRAILAIYSDAYELMDDYCGGGKLLIKDELLRVVRATFRRLNLL